ncbi:hypothetical protein A1Q_3821 [Vibrio campbellii HY01]|nr:hypothetical protein A1Q_3821 [Vibrio campbellii HY01]
MYKANDFEMIVTKHQPIRILQREAAFLCDLKKDEIAM